MKAMDYNNYFPEQYARSRHYVKKMIDKFQSLDFWNDYRGDFCEFISSPTVNAWKEFDLAEDYISFNRSGRNIIEIPNFLCELLGFTDIDNVRLDDIKMPYNTVYFHFGKSSYALCNISEEVPHVIGVYVTNIKIGDIRLFKFTIILEGYHSVFVTANLESDTNKKIDIPTINDCLIISDFLDNAFCNGESTCEYDYADIKTCADNLDNDTDTEACRIICDTIRLIVNCICYLNSTEKDILFSTTNEQATELLQQLEQAKKSQQRTKITQKLSKLSYSRIHLLGQNLQEEYDSLIIGKEVEPHWRRGHWRNQPCGKGLSETRLLWIKPTIVRKDKGEPGKGHIYELNNTQS